MNLQSQYAHSRLALVGSTTYTFGMTVASATGRCLLVGVGAGKFDLAIITSVTYGGVAMTQGAITPNVNQPSARVWYLMNPPVGTANVVVTTSSNSNAGGWFSQVWDGVDTTITPPSGNMENAAGTSISPTVTVGGNDLAVLVGMSQLAGLAAASGSTSLGLNYADGFGGSSAAGCVYRAAGQPGMTATSGQIAGATLVLKGVAAALAFTGTIGAQTGLTGTAFTWSGAALSSFYSGGTPPYVYSIFSGALPAGLSLNTSTGVISGTPTAAGVATIVVRATDAVAAVVNSNSFTITITVPPATALQVGGPSSGQTGVASGTITITANGSLAASKTVAGSDGAGGTVTFAGGTTLVNGGSVTVTYTPSSAGAKTVTFTVSDASLTAAALSYTSNTNPGTVTVPGLSAWTGTAQAALTVPNVVVVQRSNRAQVLALTAQSANGSGDLVITNGALAAGVGYMVLGFTDDGSSSFRRAVTGT